MLGHFDGKAWTPIPTPIVGSVVALGQAEDDTLFVLVSRESLMGLAVRRDGVWEEIAVGSASPRDLVRAFGDIWIVLGGETNRLVRLARR